MNHSTFVFSFGEHVDMAEVEQTLELARMACEALHGPDRIVLETLTSFDPASRQVCVTGSTPPGRDLAAIFFGYARREYGPSAVHVRSRNGPESGGCQ